MRYSATKLMSLAVLVASNGAVARASAIDISGSVAGTATVDLAGRCAPFPTVSATGTGVATGLDMFNDVQSHCTNGNFAFSQGIFDLVSTNIPENSLFGTYTGTAELEGELLDFSATLVVTDGTGAFTNAIGTLLSTGTLNETTGSFAASFAGSVSTVPEPSTVGLIAMGLTALCQIHRQNREKVKSSRSPGV